jgi:hypothetical protein
MPIPESPAFPMPTPRAATTARIHSPIDMWGVALHHTDLADPAPPTFASGNPDELIE